ncbi:MAG: 4-hydroxy-tetrahydrodipicolinate synthase [Firmicutes bacterium ADurb.Bin248]|mgnify:CR=1 FL=1|nr:MAG: 4-hydroxy-tetrahydrodipicolinate synthase [Firmicutes bacterium ADurb.Bin248]HOG00270.1 4-hydroxy-tetrahydrodipicolinate synthase [Clostridia bacterium]HPK16680.1 4-hydroxy-tetrahydrodipicolinate synthase [Clostridia bacterium]
MKSWGRLITAMVTPMDEQGGVNYEKAAEIARRFVEEGTTALVVSGTTGESPTLSAAEKEKLFIAIKKAVDVPVIAGAGTNSTAASIENARRALDCGVDGLLAVVPYYNKPNQDSIYAHFAAFAQATPLPVMLYNVPGRTGTNMTAETSIALSQIPNITALKEASGDLVQLAKVVRDANADFAVYTGEDAQILPTLAVGGYGVVSVASQVVGREIQRMIESHLAGRAAEAAELHLKLVGIVEKLFMTANPIPIKAALNLMGLEVGCTRLPLAPPAPAVVRALREELTALNLISGG